MQAFGGGSRSAVLDNINASAANTLNAVDAQSFEPGLNAEEAEYLATAESNARILTVEPIGAVTGELVPGSTAWMARNATALRWAGRGLIVVSFAISGYRVATANEAQRARIFGEEAGGQLFGIGVQSSPAPPVSSPPRVSTINSNRPRRGTVVRSLTVSILAYGELFAVDIEPKQYGPRPAYGAAVQTVGGTGASHQRIRAPPATPSRAPRRVRFRADSGRFRAVSGHTAKVCGCPRRIRCC